MLTSWSPSRLEKYESCPARAKYELIDKLCPMCFQGKVMGGFDSPAICDHCGKEVEKSAPLERGTEIGKSLENYLTSKARSLHKEIRHPKVKQITKDLRDKHKDGKVQVEHNIVLGANWKPVSPYDKKAWLRAKLDVLVANGDEGEVIDWKTGGIDKRTGSVRDDAKYVDQLNIYAVATLCAFPELKSVRTSLVFVDCGPRFDPVIAKKEGDVERKDLSKHMRKWEMRVRALLSDDVFAPRPSDKCRWCPFRKENEGPCPY